MPSEILNATRALRLNYLIKRVQHKTSINYCEYYR